MEVILLERVEKLGQMGDAVNVKPGFARNFLLPKKKALRSTAENRKLFEAQKVQLETNNLEQKKEAEAIAAKMKGLSIVVLRQASESGQLYGSVNSRDIAEAVTAAGFTVDRHQIHLAATIKHLGLSVETVRLHPEVSMGVTVNVARSADEAAAQASGKSMNASDAFFESEDLAARALEESEAADFDESNAPSEPRYAVGEEPQQDA